MRRHRFTVITGGRPLPPPPAQHEEFRYDHAAIGFWFAAATTCILGAATYFAFMAALTEAR